MNNNETEPTDSVEVVSLLPFWRYAVGPTSGCVPAIPFMRRKPALEFFEEAMHELPWAGVKLYRRTWRGVEVDLEYTPASRGVKL